MPSRTSTGVWSGAISGRPDDAEADFRKVLADKVRATDDKPEARRLRAAAFGYLALVLAHNGGGVEETLDARRQAVAIRKKLVEDFPDRLDYRLEQAVGYNDLGYSLKGAEAESARSARPSSSWRSSARSIPTCPTTRTTSDTR